MKKFYTPFASMLGAILLIGVAYRLDNWIDHLRRVSQQEFSGALAWVAPAYLADVFIDCLLLLWSWFVHYKVQKNRGLALIYILLGAGLILYNIAVLFFASTHSTTTVIFFFTVAPESLSAFVSAFITGFGLQRLIFGQSAL